MPFTSIRAADLPLVGGKGANLGALTANGFVVPSGFCVTTTAFRHFMSAAEDELYARLATVTPTELESLRLVGEEVRAALRELPLPDEVRVAVLAAWRELGREKAYAIRSSATAEDLPDASFAGQQDTYLNIVGEAALLEHVKECFISLFADRAILYRMQNGFDHRQVALSVVVQQMIEAQLSGILFTADPISGQRHVATIDASYGLGEALVSGLVSADHYKVDKRTQEIVERQIGAKALAIRPVPGGGTEQVELDESARQQAALTDVQIVELTTLGSRVEAHYGQPQDIEWAIADEQIYLLQARPITALFPIPEPFPEDDSLHVYMSFSHFQMMIDAIPPLSISILRTLLPLAKTDGQLESALVKQAAGRFYADLSLPLRHPLLKRILLKALPNADELSALGVAEIAGRTRFKAKGGRWRPPLNIFATIQRAYSVMRLFWQEDPEGKASQTTAFVEEQVQMCRQSLQGSSDLQVKLDVAVARLLNIFEPVWSWVPYLAVGVISSRILGGLMSKRAAPEILTDLEAGLQGNVVTEMNLELGDLADRARSSSGVAEILLRADLAATERIAMAAAIPAGASFTSAWREFLGRYGVRGPAEIDLSQPRWGEDPTSLLQMVNGMIQYGEQGAHRVGYGQLMAKRAAAEGMLLQAAGQGLFGIVRRRVVGRLLALFRNYGPLREHHKHYVMSVLAEIKLVLLEVGHDFVASGRLSEVADIWYLTLPELLAAYADEARELRPLIARRRQEMSHFQKLTPPRVITSEGEIPIVKLSGRGAPAGALLGTPVSAGIVEGIARVIHDPATETLAAGEILVARFTDPGWTPLFINAVGLVTEVGGVLTHGSVVAREYGIPAVVGVIDATTEIKSGQRIRVNGREGYVEIMGAGE